MSMDYIRRTYKVPAKRGGRICFTGNKVKEPGTIRSAIGSHLRVQLDGSKRTVLLHPTWCVEYLNKETNHDTAV